MLVKKKIYTFDKGYIFTVPTYCYCRKLFIKKCFYYEKIDKKSLEELAKEMPTLSEAEQQQTTGGEIFFDQYGTFIGQYGSSNEVRILQESYYFDSGSISPDTSFSGSYIDSGINNLSSTSLDSVSSDVQYNIINYMAGTLGINESVFLYSGAVTERGKYTTSLGIGINNGSNAFSGGNYYDLLLTLEHEKIHMEQDPSSLGSDYSEYLACKRVAESPYFSLASEQYQNSIRNRLNALSTRI